MGEDPTDRARRQRAFLLAGAAWQDSLLQGYRSISLTVSSILLAVAIGLSVVAISSDRLVVAASTAVMGSLLSVLGLSLSYRFANVIKARGNDVDYWHRELIKSENYLPPEDRIFTLFKYSQRRRRDGEATKRPDELHSLADGEIQDLLSKHSGHTRTFIDHQLEWGIRSLWILLTAGSLVAVLLKTS